VKVDTLPVCVRAPLQDRQVYRAVRRSLHGAQEEVQQGKNQVVEELLAGEVTQAQLARRYDISERLIIQWRRRYAEGKLEETVSASSSGGVVGREGLTAPPRDERIKELERMVGRRLTMENELLKKGARFALARENERSSVISGPTP